MNAKHIVWNNIFTKTISRQQDEPLSDKAPVKIESKETKSNFIRAEVNLDSLPLVQDPKSLTDQSEGYIIKYMLLNVVFTISTVVVLITINVVDAIVLFVVIVFVASVDVIIVVF